MMRTISDNQFQELAEKAIYFDSICLALGITHPQDVLSVVKHMKVCCPDAVSVVALPRMVPPPCHARPFSEGC